MVETPEDVEAAIDEGYASAQRGEFLMPEQVRAQLDRMKREWLARRASRLAKPSWNGRTSDKIFRTG